MGALPAPRRPARDAGVAAGVTAVGVGLLYLAYTGQAPVVALAGVTVLVWAAVTHSFFLRWDVLLIGLVVVIMFIPIGRYTLPGSLPFQLEPYRVIVAAIGVIWIMCLLIQSDTRWRPSGFGGPLALIAVAVVLSDGVNGVRIHDLGVTTEVIKGLTYFASYLLVMVLVANVVRSESDIDAVLKALVGCGAFVAVATIVESRSGFNPFNLIHWVLPILSFDAAGVPSSLEARGGEFRALASAQHPIALGAVLALLIPPAIYLARRFGGARWWIACGALALGVLATVARTATLMLIVEVLVLLALKPRTMIRLWPWALPFLVVVHIAAPGTLGSLKTSFFPKGGLVAEQQAGAGTYGSNRLADLGPGLQEFKRQPYFGQGFGTRITEKRHPKYNAPILDNNWLAWMLEVGLLGCIGLLWLFGRAVRRLGKAARRDPTERGWLYAGLAASVLAFAIGIATFDALAFAQVTFVLFVLLGLSGAALRLRAADQQLTVWLAPAERPRASIADVVPSNAQEH